MAYLDLTQGFVPTGPRTDRPVIHAAVSPAPVRPTLTRLERLVIHIAQGDGISSLAEPKRQNRFLRWLLRPDHANPLADPRLEALRRYAVLLHTQDGLVDDDETQRLLAAGFDHALLDEIRRVSES